MKESIFQTNDKKSTSLLIDQKEAGKLVFRKSFSYTADLQYGNKNYQIEPKGFWGRTIELKEYGQVLMKLKMNWSSHFIIENLLGGGQQQFTLKPKGFVKTKYILTDSYERELFTIIPKHSWTKTDFLLTISDGSGAEPDPFLLLIALYCTKYILSVSAAAAM